MSAAFSAARKDGELSPPKEIASCHVQQLADRYEELRAQGAGKRIGATPGMGLALFLRRGMPDWIAAWSNCQLTVTPPLPKPRVDHSDLLPQTLQAQVALLLAEMVLYGRREVHS